MHHLIFPVTSRNQLFLSFIHFFLTIGKGSTSATVVVPHNLNHHIHNNSDRDWIRTSLAGTGPYFIRAIRYVIQVTLEMNIERRKPDAPKPPKAVVDHVNRQRVVLWIWIALLFLISLDKALFFVVLPWILGTFGLLWINLAQHDSPSKTGVIDFTSRLGNFLLFNNGYHSAHHHAPALHWSELPALHHRLKEEKKLLNVNEEKSLTRFIFRKWILNDLRACFSHLSKSKKEQGDAW